MDNKNKNVVLFIWRSSKKYFGFIILLAILAGMISGSFIMLALLSKKILDIATNVKEGNIFVYAIAIIAIIGIQALFNVLISNIQIMATGKIEIKLKQDIFENLVNKKYESISKIHSGEILNRFTSDVGIVSNSLVSIVPYTVSLCVRLLGGLFVLIYIDLKFTLLICIIGFIIFVCSKFLSPVFKKLHKKVQETDGFVRSFVQECIENIVVIKSFVSSKNVISRLDLLQKENYETKIKRNAFSNIANTGVYVLFTLSYYAALLYGAFGLMNNSITFGSLTAFLQVIEQVKAPMKNISGILPQYYQMIASAERILELLNMPDEKCDKEYDIELYNRASKLVFDNITFKYKDENVVENATAVFEKGRITAISGPSGIGKSTVMKLLLSLIEPESGSIYFKTENENVPISKGTRVLFAYVPQGNMLLSGTIRENIAFCCNEVSDEDIEKAAELACAKEFIDKLPDKFESKIGERGIGLSEGQIQRIAVARALLINSPIILLDEATSALDSETEQKLINNLKKMKDKMCIFISHKKSTLMKCDIIYEIIDKKLVNNTTNDKK